MTLRQGILAREAAREIARVAHVPTKAATDSRPPALPARFAVWGEPSEDEGWHEVPARRAAPRQTWTKRDWLRTVNRFASLENSEGQEQESDSDSEPRQVPLGGGQTSHSRRRNAARRTAVQGPLLELEDTVGPVSSRMSIAEVGYGPGGSADPPRMVVHTDHQTPPGKPLRRLNLNSTRNKFAGPDGPVGTRMPDQPAVEEASLDPLPVWVPVEARGRNRRLACSSPWPTPKESSVRWPRASPAAPSASARPQAAPRAGARLPLTRVLCSPHRVLLRDSKTPCMRSRRR